MTINTKICNRANYGGKRYSTKYLVIHFTSNKGDTANNNATYFNREALKNPASAHYFVDENEIWSSVPEDYIAYHCGAKTYYHDDCRNSNSIGIEICMNDKNGNIRIDSILNSLELVRSLMKKYSIPIKNVLRHYDVTHKYCPGPMIDNPTLWEIYKEQIVNGDTKVEEEEEMKHYKYVTEMPTWAQSAANKAVKKGIISLDENGALDVWECNLQNLVWMDRAGLLDLDTTVYKTLDDIPEWYKETISKLITNGTIKGNDKGELNLTNDIIRSLVIVDRNGFFK